MREQLGIATLGLDREIRFFMSTALTSRRHRIGFRDYENELTVCPFVAAAKEAGIWKDGGIVPGHAAWGTPEEPSDEVVEFAARFDICAAELDVGSAIAVILDALADTASIPLAA